MVQEKQKLLHTRTEVKTRKRKLRSWIYIIGPSRRNDETYIHNAGRLSAT